MVSVERMYLNFAQKGTLTNVLSLSVVVFFLQLEQSKLEGDFRKLLGRTGSIVRYVRRLNYSRYVYVLMTTVSNPILQIKSY